MKNVSKWQMILGFTLIVWICAMAGAWFILFFGYTIWQSMGLFIGFFIMFVFNVMLLIGVKEFNENAKNY